MTDRPEEIPGEVAGDPSDSLRIAPNRYTIEDGALDGLGRHLAADADVTSIGVLGGKTGYAAVRNDLERSLEGTGKDVRFTAFTGDCCPSVIATHRERIEAERPDVLIGVGGGKAIDTAKIASEGLCPVVAVPTSAATCAAWTPLTVVYESDGTYRGGVSLSRCPEWAVVDVGTVVDAPARLFANGIMDASAKYFETRTIRDPERPATRWGVDLAAETYHTDLREKGVAAYEDVLENTVTDDVTGVLEAIMSGPGLVAGLLSDRSYLGLAHAICYSLLDHGSVLAESYHGERVAYGVLTLQALQDVDEAELRELREWYESLGAEMTLTGLGVEDVEETIEPLARDAAEKLGKDVLPRPVSGPDVEAAIRRVEGISAERPR